jgi:hypothetical protein
MYTHTLSLSLSADTTAAGDSHGGDMSVAVSIQESTVPAPARVDWTMKACLLLVPHTHTHTHTHMHIYCSMKAFFLPLLYVCIYVYMYMYMYIGR